MANNINLKDCPFCGRIASIRNWRKQDSEFMQHGSIGCMSCNYSMNWSDIRTDKRYDTNDEKECIKKWNRRN